MSIAAKAMVLRGIFAISTGHVQLTPEVVDTFDERWDDLPPAARARWCRLVELVEQARIFTPEVTGTTPLRS